MVYRPILKYTFAIGLKKFQCKTSCNVIYFGLKLDAQEKKN